MGKIACSDAEMMTLAANGARVLLEEARCRTATVLLTSPCMVDGHGTHVTVAVVNPTGVMAPSEARAMCRRLRSLADELEKRFAPKGSEN